MTLSNDGSIARQNIHVGPINWDIYIATALNILCLILNSNLKGDT